MVIQSLQKQMDQEAMWHNINFGLEEHQNGNQEVYEKPNMDIVLKPISLRT
jgi:hypothetical protein